MSYPARGGVNSLHFPSKSKFGAGQDPVNALNCAKVGIRRGEKYEAVLKILDLIHDRFWIHCYGLDHKFLK